MKPWLHSEEHIRNAGATVTWKLPIWEEQLDASAAGHGVGDS
jgi:hypothetical protein